MTTPCDLIAAQLGGLFTCAPIRDFVRIRTPYLYPDGDVVDLYLKQTGTWATLTDFGETMRWLRTQTVAPRRSAKQKQLVEDVCLNHGVEFFKGMLTIRVPEPASLAQSLVRLSEAVIRVADIWFLLRSRSVETFTDEVGDFLEERGVPHERSEKLLGRSGRIWTPDFHTRRPNRSCLVYALSTGSRATSRRLCEHVVASWHDLSHLRLGTDPLHFVSLFDDSIDVWTTEDMNLVGDLSDVALWSKTDEFAGLIAA